MGVTKRTFETIYLDPDKLDLLKQLAERTRIPRAVLAREAIDNLLTKYKMLDGGDAEPPAATPTPTPDPSAPQPIPTADAPPGKAAKSSGKLHVADGSERASVRESDRARFNRLLERAKQEQLTELRAGFYQAVQAEVDKRLPTEAQREIERAREDAEAANELERIWRHRSLTCLHAMRLFMDNWRLLVGCLHPDRSEHLSSDEQRDRFAKATDIVIRTRTSIEKTDSKKW